MTYVVPPDFATIEAKTLNDNLDPPKALLEKAFYEWWADNHGALSLGSTGDVLSLLESLSAAAAKASTS